MDRSLLGDWWGHDFTQVPHIVLCDVYTVSFREDMESMWIHVFIVRNYR